MLTQPQWKVDANANERKGNKKELGDFRFQVEPEFRGHFCLPTARRGCGCNGYKLPLSAIEKRRCINSKCLIFHYRLC